MFIATIRSCINISISVELVSLPTLILIALMAISLGTPQAINIGEGLLITK